MEEVKAEYQSDGLELFLVKGPFDKAKATIEQNGGKIAPTQQVAKMHVACNMMKDCIIAENIIHFPNNDILVTSADYSPILKYASEATKAYEERHQFFISEEEAASLLSIAKEDSEKPPAEQRVYTLAKIDKYPFPIFRMIESPLAQFLFKDTLPAYASYLQNKFNKSCERDTTKTGKDMISILLPNVIYREINKTVAMPILFYNATDVGWWCDDMFTISPPSLMGYESDQNWVSLNTAADKVAGIRSSTVSKLSYESVMQKYGAKSPEDLDRILAQVAKNQ